jgi:predicted metalloprotease with PDZ domain
MWPYVYSTPEPTPWLWVSEGITDYYADLAEVRGKVVTDSSFYALTAAKVNEVSAAPATALQDASLNTWTHPVDGSEYLYYPKGSLAGLMLDILIRDASDNQRSLDTVMRDLYQAAYKQGRGFTSTDWWGAVSRAAGGASFDQFNARFVDGRDPLPLDSILGKAGLRLVRTTTPRLGVYSQQDATGVLVTAIEPGGAAAVAGVRAGDYLISVGDIPVQDQNFGDNFRKRFGSAPEGTPIPIRIRRMGQIEVLTGAVRFAPGDARIEADPQAGAKAVRIRAGILSG